MAPSARPNSTGLDEDESYYGIQKTDRKVSATGLMMALSGQNDALDTPLVRCVCGVLSLLLLHMNTNDVFAQLQLVFATLICQRKGRNGRDVDRRPFLSLTFSVT